VLDKCYNDGELFWDSADVYGDSEELLGKTTYIAWHVKLSVWLTMLTGNWFKQNPGKREEIFLATKFANKALPDGGREIDSSPEYCRSSVEKSLKRLGLPFVDLYYVHRLDNKTPIEKTMVCTYCSRNVRGADADAILVFRKFSSS